MWQQKLHVYACKCDQGVLSLQGPLLYLDFYFNSSYIYLWAPGNHPRSKGIFYPIFTTHSYTSSRLSSVGPGHTWYWSCLTGSNFIELNRVCSQPKVGFWAIVHSFQALRRAGNKRKVIGFPDERKVERKVRKREGSGLQEDTGRINRT